MCSRLGDCTSHLDCASYASCSAEECNLNPDCMGHGDCPLVQSCFSLQCLRNATCLTNLDCPLTQQCTGNVCSRIAGCTSAMDCPPLMVCLDGQCARGEPCRTEMDCPTNQSCVAGNCLDLDACTLDTDCHPTRHCEAPLCVRNDPCSTQDECPPTQACINNTCTQFTGTGTLTCPPAPVGVRILQPVVLTATLGSVVPGTFSIRWTNEGLVDSFGISRPDELALVNADTAVLSLTPVVAGQYRVGARLTQRNGQDQTCVVEFTVGAPVANLNVQLNMNQPVDVDLHLLHNVGQASGMRAPQDDPNWFFTHNWGPPEGFTCENAIGLLDCPALETRRAQPDCHFSNCSRCTVVMPDQPACTPRLLRWDQDVTGMLSEPNGTQHTYTYPFTAGGSAASEVNPSLDIDNRRGCYMDALGVRVCTPENISILSPNPGTYTLAVHYFGEPFLPGVPGSNRRGQPPGATTSVEVQLFCRGPATSMQGGFRRFQCNDIPVNGWCFPADVTFGPQGCTAITAATRTFTF